jgi:hypothetical protein
VCGLHTPVSEIYSQAHVDYAPTRGRRIVAVLVADGSGDTRIKVEGRMYGSSSTNV